MKPLRSVPLGARGSLKVLLGLLLLPSAFGSLGIDSTAVKALFRNPPAAYSSGPLWVWNDWMTEQEVRDTLRDLASQKVKQAWVHPRPGLMTPYLSPEWFHLWQVALEEAKHLDMDIWIYDENSYPSGFAGGLVPESMPESRGRGLVFRESRTAPVWTNDLLGVFGLEEGSCTNLTSVIRNGASLAEARYLSVYQARAANSPWYGNRCYVNLLSPGVTEKFLELTLEAYRKNVGTEFGKRIPGVFSDEPNIHPAGDLPWSEILAAEFRKRWGYDLMNDLPSLARPVGDWRKVRHNYFQLLNEQFIEHWAKPYHDYCERHKLEWTGHYWDHEWPNCLGVPDNMAMYAWHQRPAIDCLMNQYAEHTHAQFGNVRMVKELSSIANQLGLPRTLCEVYGAGGWDLRFEDMKRIADWLAVLGVNTFNQHLSYVTIRGARKRDHPQSFSYHEPWWEAYHVSAQYLARLSAALSQGQQINRVLVLEPTTTAWMYQGDSAKLQELGDAFFKLLLSLEAAQIEYDIGSEDVIARQGHVSGRELQIGKRSYRCVLLPPLMENLNYRTKNFLDQVHVVVAGPGVQRIDGTLLAQAPPSQADQTRTNLTAWLAQTLVYLRQEQNREGFRIDRASGDEGILFHHRRQLADGELLFLANTSIEHPSAGVVTCSLQGVERWDPYTGLTEPYPCERSSEGVSARFELPPSGSLLLFLSRRPSQPASVSQEVRVVPPVGEVQVKRLEPNILTLDYVDITAGGETRTNLYFYQANQFAWKENGMQRDPWDSAVQFRDEFMTKRFPAESGFQAQYKFTISGPVPSDLEIVLERPELYTITCNGKPVAARPGRWWLDKAFGRVPLASAACPGQNIVSIKASPFTMFHELESAYVLGSFSLSAQDHGFQIEPDHDLRLSSAHASPAPGPSGESHSWAAQGLPFYSAGVAYREEFNLGARTGRYKVSLGNWRGSVAKVAVNGKAAGYIDAPPWECDVSRWIKPGQNQLEVTVIGTLKNTLGPHHGNPVLGAAWPGNFQKAPLSGPPPGASYDTVAYGLFEPFTLKQMRER